MLYWIICFGKAYTNNKFTGLKSTDYLNLKYNNSVDLSIILYNKIETGNLLANKISTTGDAVINGNLNVSKIITFKRVPALPDTSSLTIIDDSQGGSRGVLYQSISSGLGFSIAYMTAQSSAAWVESVNGCGANEFIMSGSNGSTIRPPGDAAITGNLDVGANQSINN